MMRKLMIMFAVALLGVAAFTSPATATAASPVTAKTIFYNCNDSVTNEKGQVCLYNYINTVKDPGGFWQRSFVYIGDQNDGGFGHCVDLGPHNWHNTTAGSVNNEASSLIIAGITFPPNGLRFTFYDRANCVASVPSDYYFDVIVGGPTHGSMRRLANLADISASCDYGWCNLNWANRIGSVSVYNA